MKALEFRTVPKLKPSGFSLIEILIAMAIMAVLMGIAIPYLGKSSDTFAKEEIYRLLAAIEMVRDKAVIENREYGLNIDENGYQFLILNDDFDEPSGGKGAGKSKGKSTSKDSSGRDSSGRGSSAEKGREGGRDNASGKEGEKAGRANNKPQWSVIEDVAGLSPHEFREEVEVNVAIDGDNIFKPAEDEVQIFEEDVNIFEDEKDEEVKPPQIYFLSSGEQNQFTIAVAVNDEYQSDRDDILFFRIQGLLTGKLQIQGPLPGNLFQDIERDYSEYLAEE